MPKMPSMPSRQATKLPDAGADIPDTDRRRVQRAMFAGLRSSGMSGSPSPMSGMMTGKATLG
jgi:hypothetical protein